MGHGGIRTLYGRNAVSEKKSNKDGYDVLVARIIELECFDLAGCYTSSSSLVSVVLGLGGGEGGR